MKYGNGLISTHTYVSSIITAFEVYRNLLAICDGSNLVYHKETISMEHPKWQTLIDSDLITITDVIRDRWFSQHDTEATSYLSLQNIAI